MASSKNIKRKPNKEYMKKYMWFNRNIWKDKTTWPPIDFKKFYHFIKKCERNSNKES